MVKAGCPGHHSIIRSSGSSSGSSSYNFRTDRISVFGDAEAVLAPVWLNFLSLLRFPPLKLDRPVGVLIDVRVDVLLVDIRKRPSSWTGYRRDHDQYHEVVGATTLETLKSEWLFGGDCQL